MLSEGSTKLLQTWTFAQLPAAAIVDPELSSSGLRLLAYMCWRRGQDGTMWASVGSMAQDLSVTDQSIRNWGRELVARGYLEIDAREGQTNIYRLTRRAAVGNIINEGAEGGKKSLAEGGQKLLKGGVKESLEGGSKTFEANDMQRTTCNNETSPTGATPEPSESMIVPQSYDAWCDALAQTKNPCAVMKYMIESLYPGRAPPDYSRIGGAMRTTGSWRNLAMRVWTLAARPPAGELLDYIQAEVSRAREDRRKGRRKGGNGSAPDPTDLNNPDVLAAAMKRSKEAAHQQTA